MGKPCLNICVNINRYCYNSVLYQNKIIISQRIDIIFEEVSKLLILIHIQHWSVEKMLQQLICSNKLEFLSSTNTVESGIRE